MLKGLAMKSREGNIREAKMKRGLEEGKWTGRSEVKNRKGEIPERNIRENEEIIQEVGI